MTAASAISYWALLRQRQFAWLFVAQTVSLVGSGITTVALGLLAYELAGGQAAAVLGAALTLRIVAYVVFAPIAGVIADRIHRKRLLLAMDAVRFAVIAVMPWVDAVWQVYLLIFLLNVASAFHTPVYQSVIPDIVPDDPSYLRALSLSRLAYDMQNLASPALAALLVAALGFRPVFFFDAATFAVSFLIVLFVAIPSPRARKTASALRDLPRQSLYGIKILLTTPSTRFLLLLNFAVALGGAVAIVDTVVYLKDVLHLPDSALGAVLATLGAGSVIGAYFIPRWVTRFGSRRVMLVGGLLLGISLLPGFLRPALGLLMALWFLNGAGQAMIGVIGGTFLKEASGNDDRARIYAAHFSLSHAAWLLAYPLAGGLGTQLGVPWTMTTMGVAVFIVVWISALSWRAPERAAIH